MDRKTAIDWLKSIRRGVHGGDEEYDRRRKEALDMAIEALKAQESRVMKFNELEDTIADRAVWYEAFLTEVPTIAIVCEKSIADDAYTIFDFISGRHRVTRKTYGAAWRCWTARPTEEQREAAKWDAEDERADHIRPYTELSAQTALLEHRYSGLISED